MAVDTLARHSTREQLLAAGREIVLKRGFQGLTVREIAAPAGANLGSFVYHFGTRDAFLRELIEDWYAPLLSRVSDVADSARHADRPAPACDSAAGRFRR